MKNSLTLLALLALPFLAIGNTIDLQTGMTIRQSVTITQKIYHLNGSHELSNPVLIIDGNNITLDFNGAVLQGSNEQSRPDELYGLAILIKKGSKNIILKNAFIHGFKVGLFADSVENLTILHCDLSYNWRQHLHSNLDREDISDWMSYHKNEQDEWLRYGAAIYLKNCNQPIITNNTITGGQCALMMTSTEKAEVYDNDFSFNSGIGIGLYRSSNNIIYHNRVDFNVRGFSDGKYKRGQDSAGFLVFEQSSQNIFAFNSATHSGDGFFLWAGQTTMDSGTGGCNDNFIYGNDFSYAPTNGIEVTFSKNLIMKNKIHACDHGIWGGYSYDTDITDNNFENNRIGIAIEHGQTINIALNSFTGDLTGIKLWSREKQPDDWAYAKLRNTESRNYWIASNRFSAIQTAIDIMGTDTVVLSGNSKLQVTQPLKLGERADNIDTSREDSYIDIDYQKDERLTLIKADQLPDIRLPQGKKEMRITEWGPYDFRYPILWLQKIDSNDIYHFEVLGPKGKWDLAKQSGFAIMSKGSDSFPSFIIARADSTQQQRSIQLTYTGPDYIDAFGKQQTVNMNRTFAYRAFHPLANWQIQWYKWGANQDPSKDYQHFIKLFEQAPIYSVNASKVDYTWWGRIEKDLPADSFATVAISTMQLKKGTYDLGVTADDFVKLFIDDIEIIDAWDTKYTIYDETTHHKRKVTLTEGKHIFKIIHAENTGLATLSFYINPE